jgi:hypothetical protein
MELKDLPIGSKIIDKESSYPDSTPVAWIVLDQNHTEYPTDTTTLITERAYLQNYFHVTDVNIYEASWIKSYLNTTFKNMLSKALKENIKSTEVKTFRQSCADFNLTNEDIFLLSSFEVYGITDSTICTGISEGVQFEYFKNSNNRLVKGTSSTNVPWHTRSRYNLNDTQILAVRSSTNSYAEVKYASSIIGTRPVLNIWDKLEVFDEPNDDGYYRLMPSFDIKYLIKSNDIVFTLENGDWIDINARSLVDANDFLTRGLDDLSIITEEQWSQLQKPIEVLTWTDSTEANLVKVTYTQKKFENNPKLELTVDEYKPIMTLDDPEIVTLTDSDNPLLYIGGFRDLRPYCKSDVKNLLIQSSTEPNMKITSVPKPQLIKPKDDIVFRELSKVLDFQVTAAELNEGKIRIIFSIDSGTTWMTYNEATQDFVEINGQDLDEIEENGIKISVFNSIKEKWGDIVTKGKVRFAYYLKIDNLSDTAEIDELIATLNILGFWESTIHEEDYDYRYDNVIIYIELYRDGSYKINYME